MFGASPGSLFRASRAQAQRRIVRVIGMTVMLRSVLPSGATIDLGKLRTTDLGKLRTTFYSGKAIMKKSDGKRSVSVLRQA